MGYAMGAEAGREPPSLNPLLGVLSAGLGAVAMIGGVVVFGRVARLPVRTSLVLGSLLLALPGLAAIAASRLPLGRTLAWRGGGTRTYALAAGLGVGLWVLSLGLLEIQFAVLPPPA